MLILIFRPQISGIIVIFSICLTWFPETSIILKLKNLRLPLFKQQNWRIHKITSYRRFVLFVIVIRHDIDCKIIIIFPTKSHCTSTLHTNLVPLLGFGCDYDVCSISTCFQAWSFLIQVMADGLGTKLLLNLLNFSVAFWLIKICYNCYSGEIRKSAFLIALSYGAVLIQFSVVKQKPKLLLTV